MCRQCIIGHLAFIMNTYCLSLTSSCSFLPSYRKCRTVSLQIAAMYKVLGSQFLMFCMHFFCRIIIFLLHVCLSNNSWYNYFIVICIISIYSIVILLLYVCICIISVHRMIILFIENSFFFRIIILLLYVYATLVSSGLRLSSDINHLLTFSTQMVYFSRDSRDIYHLHAESRQMVYFAHFP